MDLKKKILFAAICIVIIIAAAAALYIGGLGKALDSDNSQTVSSSIPSGSSTAQIGQMLEEKGIKPDVIVLDPPRKGCEASLVETVCNMSPDRVVYVSCDPATLARDLDILCHQGRYQLVKVQPVDLFPNTAHVETVVLLSREDN